MLRPLLGVLAAASLWPAGAAPVTIQVRNASGEPLADAVVAVLLRGRPAKAAAGRAEMGQRDRQFQPRLLVVQSGTAVSFPNFDSVRHHVYSISPTKVFDIRLYSGTPAEPVVFDKPGIATLGCNIHDRMAAHIIVVDTPIFTRTDAQGLAALDLPAGDHVVQAWHLSMKTPDFHAESLAVPASGATAALTLKD